MLRFHILHIFRDSTIFSFYFEINEYFLSFLFIYLFILFYFFFFLGGGGGGGDGVLRWT